MEYKIFESRDDTRVIVLYESGGFIFTHDDEYQGSFDNKHFVYDDLGEPFVAETLDGSDVDDILVGAAWRKVNDYWQQKNSPKYPLN